MEKLVELYDPHPGLAGAIVPLPKSMKEIANSLDGKIMTLEKAVEEIIPIAEKIGGKVEVIKEHKYISFEFGKGMINSYRLIRYR